MAILQVGTTHTFPFADGNAGHSCSFGSAPNANEFDILCVNSNTVVATPSGFTSVASAVNNQGSYIFARKAAGGESSSVTVTTTGDFNTQVTWSRWSGLSAFDVAATAQINATSGEGTPAATTAALAGTGELAILFAALHSTGTANQTNPTWTVGYTTLGSAVQGAGAAAVVGFTAYRTNAGATAETANNTGWDGDGAQNRYTLLATFTPAATTETIAVAGTTGPATGSLQLVSTTITLAGTTGPAAGAMAFAPPITIVVGGTTGAATGALVVRLEGEVEERPGSWYQLLDVTRDWRQREAEYALLPPVACPNDGEPLRTGPDGGLYCPYDGWRPR